MVLLVPLLAVVEIGRAQTAGTDWRQAQGDGAHTGFAGDGPQPPYREAWHAEAPLGGPGARFGLSAPIVVGGVAISVGPRSIVAVDVGTGAPGWTIDRAFGPPVSAAVARLGRRDVLLYTEGFGDSPPISSPSPSPSPAPDPGEPIDSRLVAVDLETREPVWDEAAQLKEVSRTGVAVDAGTAFVGDNRGNVYAVDAGTGELLWSRSVGGFLATPVAVAEGVIVVTVQGARTTRPFVVAIDATDGHEAWRSEVQGGAVLASAPAIGDALVFAAFSDQTLRAFDLRTGAERWSARLNAPVTFGGAPAVAGEAVAVVDTAGQVYRFDAQTGERAWDFALNELVLRSPTVISGDHVVVTTVEGRLAALDLGSGRLVFQTAPEPDSLLRSPAVADDTVVAVRGGRMAGLVAFSHDPDGALVSIASPTTLDLAEVLGTFALVAVPLGLVVLVGGRALSLRMGAALPADDEDDDDHADEDERGAGA
jgi:outer membrane protein assembly factor BamB